jgi:predicted metal-dependent phosphoesterase TrpH
VSTIDLHIHTHYSDGRYSPSKVLAHAACLGLKTIAFTDHDNTNGVREALPLAYQRGIELVPAIELTCRWPECDTPPGDGDIDLLGYFIDLDNAAFRAFERASLADIHARMSDCCAHLTWMGYPLSLADAFERNPRYAGALQVVQAIQYKCYAESWEDALRLFGEAWKLERLSLFTIQHAIEQIHLAGGVAVLAHPAAIQCSGGWIQARQVKHLVDAGLDGLEIYHHRLNEEARAHFLSQARQFGLLVSGGSDEHGWFTDLKRMGTLPVTAAMLDALFARHLCRKAP